jgi:hypothetical protein
MCIIFEKKKNLLILIVQRLILQGFGLLVYLGNKLKVEL